jgi:hypothetical protein
MASENSCVRLPMRSYIECRKKATGKKTLCGADDEIARPKLYYRL